MGITIGIIETSDEMIQEPFVILECELLEYLAAVSNRFALKPLTQLDPYDFTLLDITNLQLLAEEVPKFIKAVKRRDLPVPPLYVGLNGMPIRDDDEEFGWRGLENFLEKLLLILKLTLKRKQQIAAIGD